MTILGPLRPKGPRRFDAPGARRSRLHERRLKTVAVLPSLATLGNLVCGLGAIYMCLLAMDAGGTDLAVETLDSARIERFFPTYVAIGGYLIFLAAMFDAIDGRLARLTRKTTEFGAQLDTLADVVSFGVAPALLAICVAKPLIPVAELSEPARIWWRIEWVMFAAYVCCAALRLARFNVENVEDEAAHMRFKGLPSPGAAAALIGLVLVHEDIIRVSGVAWASELVAGTLPLAAMLLGLLMVSRIKYSHLINTMLRGRRPFSYVVVMLFVVLVGAIVKPQLTIAGLAIGYALTGPIFWVTRRLQKHPTVSPVAAGDAADATAEQNRLAG